MKTLLRYAIATVSLMALYPLVVVLGLFLLPREIRRAVRKMEGLALSDSEVAVREALQNVQPWPPSTPARSGEPSTLVS